MKRDTLFLITTILVFFLAVVFMYSANRSFEADHNILASDSSNSVVLTPTTSRQKAIIEVASGEKRRVFEGELGGGTYSLSESLKIIAENGKFAYEIEAGKIKQFDGFGGSIIGWKIYRNGNVASMELKDQVIKGGDRYTLEYISPK